MSPARSSINRSLRPPAHWKKNRDFYNEAYAYLDSIRNVLRNSTMHVEAKYTLRQARDVMDTVRIFVSKVSERLENDGTLQEPE